MTISIHDPDVVLTDLALALLGGWLAWRLARAARGDPWFRTGALLLAALASAAFWGAVFHAFFPENTATLPGRVAWMPVSLSIVVVAAASLELALRLLAPRLPAGARRSLVLAYGLVFAAVVLLVDDSFGSIVRFYAPAVVLFLVGATAKAFRIGGGWWLIAAALALSLVAALFQRLGIAIHPVWFDHNAVYHVIQAAALVLLYLGFGRISASGSPSPDPRRAA